jgi:dTDP-4-amino-4,6-dideoxygalactose transaminase
LEAFDSNWIAPLGPMVKRFELELAESCQVSHGVALSSGTAALHLLLKAAGIGPGDRVFVSTLTFIASVNAVIYCGATPVLIDSECLSWNMDADLLQKALTEAEQRNELPKAIVVADIYGQCADYDAIEAVLKPYGIPLLEDAAEAVGSSYKDKPAGSFGLGAALSFNGNKLLTTSGGGMVVTSDTGLAKKVLYLATQAAEPTPWYEHQEIGFNYRLSNLLAAVGLGQLQNLKAKIARRKEIFDTYQDNLADIPGVAFMPVPEWSKPNYWLTCLTIEPGKTKGNWELIHNALKAVKIESRPLWKPMHLQPVHRDKAAYLNGVSDTLFRNGICLPSGSDLTDESIDRITGIVRRVLLTGQ